MNTKKKTIKSILCCTTACSAVALAGLGAMNIAKPDYNVLAKGVDSIPVSISNSNFDNSTKTSYPFNPSSYNQYNNGVKVETSNSNKANINAGVINLSHEDYLSRFTLAKRDSLDNYVLMIDSSKTENGVTTVHEANYGFQTSSTIKMEANSKYMFTVDVFTATDAKIASLYLLDNNGETISSIVGINSYNNWTTYTFLVATNNFESVEATLGMYLEGAGTVLFDNISCFKLSDSQYEFTKDSCPVGTYSEVDKINNIENNFLINSEGKFQDSLDLAHTSNLTATNYEINNKHSLSTVIDTDGQNKYAFLLENTEKTYAEYETVDNLLTFEQNSIYKVSVSVKTKDLDGTATLKLVRTDIDEDDDKYTTNYDKTIEITSNTYSDADSVTNDYKTYSFLINSHSSQAVGYKFAFGLGKDSDNKATGKMYISEIEVSRINYETFNSTSTGSGAEKINLVDVYKDSKIMLNNGDFNGFKIADYQNPMPATPIDWTVATGKNTQRYGVVNTKTFAEDLKDFSFSNLSNPQAALNNNILMMYNETADTLSYKSATKNLTSKTYHKFEVSVQTQNAPLKVSLVTTKDDKEVELASKVVNTNYSWQNVEMFLYTGYQTMDVALKLTLETEDYGYAYVDNAKFDYLLTTAQLEEAFKNAENSSLVAKVDLSNILLSNSTDNFAKTPLFSSEAISGVQSGIVTLNSSHLDEIIYDSSNLEKFNSISGNVYAIRATDDVNYTATSNIGFRLTTGTDVYYKISVSVYTQHLSTNNTEANLNDIGASIKLSGFEQTFENIKSENEWTTYTFYIQASGDTTTYLQFALGSESNPAKGDVFFGNIEFSDSITADEYNSVIATDRVKVVSAETTSTDDKDETTNDTNEDNKLSKTAWIYLIPSLLTALAILIAVIGFAVRKIKFKKRVKKTKTTYDRNRTVSIQYYTRKATTLREEKLRTLKADLDKVNAERKNFEDKYKQDLATLRTMKIKRASSTEIAKLEKDLKKYQKLSASLGVTANKISHELSYAKTDAYLNSLIKKLEREQSQNPDNSEQQ